MCDLRVFQVAIRYPWSTKKGHPPLRLGVHAGDHGIHGQPGQAPGGGGTGCKKCLDCQIDRRTRQFGQRQLRRRRKELGFMIGDRIGTGQTEFGLAMKDHES